MMKFYEKYFQQGQAGGGKKSKKGKNAGAGAGGDQTNPMQGIMGNDPQAKAQSWFQVALRAGPPVYYQARQFDSPEYKQQVELKRKEVQSELDVENKRLRLHELQNSKVPLDEAQKGELERLQEDPELFPASGLTPHYAAFDTSGASLPEGTTDVMGQPIDKTKTYRRVERGGVTSWVPSTPKAGKPLIGWSKDKEGKLFSAEIDPATNQFKAGTENYDRIPPAGMLEHVRTGEFSWTDADGNLHRSQTTTTTKPVIPGSTASSTSAPTTPAKPSAPSAETAKEGKERKEGKEGEKKSGFLAEGQTGPLGIKQSPGDRIIGNVGAKGQAKSRAEAAESVLRILPKALALLRDPAVQKNLGVLNGRWSEIEKRIGNLDPKTQQFYGELKSIYALNGAMHGWRSLKAPEEFQKAYGDLHTEPATLVGGLKAVTDTAKDVYETGFHHGWQGPGAKPSTGAPSPSGPVEPSGGSTPKTADEYLNALKPGA